MIDFCHIDGRVISTSRVILRPWTPADAAAALGIYGSPAVAHWLQPEMPRVPDMTIMARILRTWLEDDLLALPPVGRWALTLPSTDQGLEVVGGVSLLPFGAGWDDLQMALQLQPTRWGRGLATEAGLALGHYAFANGVAEVFAVVRPRNLRAAAVADRMGMEWVEETDEHSSRRLEVYRLLCTDLQAPPGGVRITPTSNAN